MKIVINAGYGNMSIPTDIKIQVGNIKKPYLEGLAEVLENLPYTHDKLTTSVYNKFTKDDKSDYLKSTDSEIIFIKDDCSFPGITKVKIVDVDISKPWRIVEYDGMESIEYFNGITVIDEKTNESDW